MKCNIVLIRLETFTNPTYLSYTFILNLQYPIFLIFYSVTLHLYYNANMFRKEILCKSMSVITEIVRDVYHDRN